jgi:hypothetical protein
MRGEKGSVCWVKKSVDGAVLIYDWGWATHNDDNTRQYLEKVMGLPAGVFPCHFLGSWVIKTRSGTNRRTGGSDKASDENFSADQTISHDQPRSAGREAAA